MIREDHWHRRTFGAGTRRLSDEIERARRAQEQHDRRMDVQLRLDPLAQADSIPPRSASASGAQGPTVPRVRDSSAPLTDREKLARIADAADKLRASLIRTVDAGAPLTVDLAAGLADVLESISHMARAEIIVPVPEPQSLRVGAPTLRVVE